MQNTTELQSFSGAHLNDDTSLFPPAKCCKDETLLTLLQHKTISAWGLKILTAGKERKKKKKRLGGAANLLIPVLGTSANAGDTPQLPCLHKLPVQVQSSTTQWTGTTARANINLWRKVLTARPCRYSWKWTMPRQAKLTLIFIVSHNKSEFLKLMQRASTHLYFV